jgi:putative oxidoreductase
MTPNTQARNALVAWSDIPLRIALAATFIAHGLDKLSHGLGGFAASLAQMGVPAPEFMAWVVTIAELGGALVLIGLFTRLAAFAIFCDMAVAILKVHLPQGFTMHAGSSPMPMGFEWQFALAMIALCLVIRGAGPFSVDELIRRRMRAEEEREEVSGVRRARATTSKASAGATGERFDAESIGEAPPEVKREEHPPVL